MQNTSANMISTNLAASGVQEGGTHCIFICGAQFLDDLWLFADFMATSKVFIKTGGIKGSYINTFPIKDYLSKNDRVAWGYEGPGTKKPLIVFNKADQPWWKDVPLNKTHKTPQLLLERLEKVGRSAKYPDKVNLFIFCRGNRQGFLQLGEGTLDMETLSRTISKKFNYGVQVNVIVAACCSGLMLDKIRGRDDRRRSVQTSASAIESSFSNNRVSASGFWRGSHIISAYINSLVLGLKTAQYKTPSRTLEQHLEFVNKLGISANKGTLGHPQSYYDKSHGELDEF